MITYYTLRRHKGQCWTCYLDPRTGTVHNAMTRYDTDSVRRDPRRTESARQFREVGINGPGTSISDPDFQGLEVGPCFGRDARTQLAAFKRDCSTGAGQWAVEPAICRVADGVPSRVDRLRGLGNAVVPQIAEFVGHRIMACYTQLIDTTGEGVRMSDFVFEGFEPANTTPVPDVCWICQYRLSPRTTNKTTKLCWRCNSDLLNKVMRQKRRARRKGNEATLTTVQWANKVRASQGHCHYCHKNIGYRALTLEHLMPIAKGGGTTDENCVPACMDCNWQQWVSIREATR